MDKFGTTGDLLLTEPRDQKAAKRFLAKAIGRNGTPELIHIDKSGAHAAAIVSDNAEHGTAMHIRQCNYVTNIVEQDHRGVKRNTRPMFACKSFASAQHTLTGIELMRMLTKRQMDGKEIEGLTAAEQFYALAS